MSFNPTTPHFDVPMRIFNGRYAVVEQDSVDDVANCVEVLLATHFGQRPEAPDFGVPDLTFKNQPLNIETIRDMIADGEPRAAVILRERPDAYDYLIERITIEVGVRGGSQ